MKTSELKNALNPNSSIVIYDNSSTLFSGKVADMILDVDIVSAFPHNNVTMVLCGDYVPQFPSLNDLYFISTNNGGYNKYVNIPTHSVFENSLLPNCTSYCFGETAKYMQWKYNDYSLANALPRANADSWFSYSNYNTKGFKGKGQIYNGGCAIVCFSTNDIGHVLFAYGMTTDRKLKWQQSYYGVTSVTSGGRTFNAINGVFRRSYDETDNDVTNGLYRSIVVNADGTLDTTHFTTQTGYQLQGLIYLD